MKLSLIWSVLAILATWPPSAWAQATLIRAELVTVTGNDDKDHDTCVFIQVTTADGQTTIPSVPKLVRQSQRKRGVTDRPNLRSAAPVLDPTGLYHYFLGILPNMARILRNRHQNGLSYIRSSQELCPDQELREMSVTTLPGHAIRSNLLAISLIVAFSLFGQNSTPIQSAWKFGQIDDAGRALNLLRTIATDAVDADNNIDNKRVRRIGKQFYLNLRAEETFDSSVVEDRLLLPLELLIRVSSLRRDCSGTVSPTTIWEPPLNELNHLVPSIVEAVFKDSNDDRWHLDQKHFEAEITTIFRHLDDSLRAFAIRENLDIVTPREAAPGYTVEVRINPAKARIRVMRYLHYRICLSFGKSLEDQWSDLQPGPQELIGRYRYLAEWPPSLNGPEEGNFEIHAKGILTFSPRSK